MFYKICLLMMYFLLVGLGSGTIETRVVSCYVHPKKATAASN